MRKIRTGVSAVLSKKAVKMSGDTEKESKWG
jgi:hypothetical protein